VTPTSPSPTSASPTGPSQATRSSPYNTGVIRVRPTTAALAFLQAWTERTGSQDATDMRPGHNGDQRFFRELIHEGTLTRLGGRLAVLDNTLYNVRPQMLERLRAEKRLDHAVIYHFRGGSSRPRSLWQRALGRLRRLCAGPGA
jgi:hypothetical protein